MLLRDRDRDRLCQMLSSFDLKMEVWAYGSRVDGTAHEGSDLDLVIRGEDLRKVSMDVLAGLKEMIMHSNIPIVVELFDWARLPASFHANIHACHEVLYRN